jgi:ArsR family transcriptional regulator, arsenate/arsenite/antimonite-responsive transcriptional repressor
MSVDLTFEALSSRPRRQILALISAEGMTTTELAERFGMSAPTISRHLTLLEQAGLVRGERQGQRVVYRLNADNFVNTVTGYMLEVCPVGGPLKRESRARAAARKAAATKPATKK